YDSGDYPRLLAEAIGLAEGEGFAARRKQSESKGQRRGMGYSCHLHGTGGVADERSVLTVSADGHIAAQAGTQSQGQGHETIFAQVVADRLGVAVDRIHLIQGDTAIV